MKVVTNINQLQLVLLFSARLHIIRKEKSKLFKPTLHWVITSWVYLQTRQKLYEKFIERFFSRNEHMVHFFEPRLGHMDQWRIDPSPTYMFIPTRQKYEVKVTWIIPMFNVGIVFGWAKRGLHGTKIREFPGGFLMSKIKLNGRL